MKKGLATRSLVPYLDQSRHPFVLKLAFPEKSKYDPENLSDPFVVLYDSDPLTRIYMGKIVTDTGEPIKDLFLLIQRGNYHRSHPAIQTLTNKTVEGMWQEVFRRHHIPGRSSIDFSANPEEDTALLPLKSLFYCAYRDIFFHPPCPKCERDLDLCRDDETLEAAGLAPCSSSLDRYLYCSACKSTFYAPQKNGSDSSSLSDAAELIRAFGQVTDDVSGSFPCAACPEKGICYGDENQAQQRILPFSFFPFHVLVFDAFPAHAMDFQALVSSKAAEAEILGPPIQEVTVPEEPPEQKAVPSKETDAALTQLLLNIREKWQAEWEKSREEAAQVIPQEVQKKAVEPEVTSPPEPLLEKTMIFSPAQMEAMPPAGKAVLEKEPVPESPPAEPQLEKTMIFSPGEMEAASSKKEDKPKEEPPPVVPPQPPAPENQLEKTMIFPPDAERRVPASPPEKPDGSGDQMEKTVIQGSEMKTNEGAGPAEKGRKDEVIPETIIMPLDELKGKKHDE